MEFTPSLIETVRGLPTPLLLVDRRIIRANYSRLAASLPGVDVFYAVKANAEPEITRILAALGAGFEVSSLGELETLLALGIPAGRIISGNPIKSPAFLKRAHEIGVKRLVFDSVTELEKLAAHAPASELYLRLVVDNSGSEWPLSRKYGVEATEAGPLLATARSLGLNVAGLTFHVGSQCLCAEAWVRALAQAREVFDEARAHGFALDSLNLGGGWPVHHLKPIPEVERVGTLIESYVAASFPAGTRLSIEPGRVLVGEAATLVTSVVGKADRADARWLYLDAGVFNALMEATGGIAYELRTERDGETTLDWTVAGPSCDSVDTLWTDVALPDLAVGDRVYIMNAGAYTLSYASSFNGFGPPMVEYIGE